MRQPSLDVDVISLLHLCTVATDGGEFVRVGQCCVE
jgi:hypothetical protein